MEVLFRLQLHALTGNSLAGLSLGPRIPVLAGECLSSCHRVFIISGNQRYPLKKRYVEELVWDDAGVAGKVLKMRDWF